MKISEFVISILNNRKNEHQKMNVAKVTKSEAEIILGKTGLNLSGYTHVVDTYGVKHAMGEHSNLSKEKHRGLIPITISDFDRIPDIVENFDDVKFGGKNKAGRNVIVYIKRMNGYVFYVEEIRSQKHKEAVIQTMYIKPKKSLTD